MTKLHCIPLVAYLAVSLSFTLVSDASAQVAAGQTPPKSAPSLSFVPAKLPGPNGTMIEAESGTLEVPANRSTGAGAPFRLAVARLKSTTPNPTLPPLIYLADGPGAPAINTLREPERGAFLVKLRENRDVILMDQRGTGRSKPMPGWLGPKRDRTGIFLSEANMIQFVRTVCAEAKVAFGEQHLDLAAFTTVENAADFRDLQLALGGQKIALLGMSYGSHLGFAILRNFPEIVERAVFAGPVGPDELSKLPADYDAQFARLTELAAHDPAISAQVPNFALLLRQVLVKLDREPLQITVLDQMEKQNVTIPLGRFGLQYILRLDAADRSDFIHFPALVWEISQGRTTLIQPLLQKRYNQMLPGVAAMPMMMRLYSGASAARRAQIKEQESKSLLGAAVNLPELNLDDVWGNPDLGEQFRRPVETSVPVLFVSGSLDAISPPYRSAEAAKHAPHSVKLLVENAGHEDLLTHPPAQALIEEYLRTGKLAQSRITKEKPAFTAVPK